MQIKKQINVAPDFVITHFGLYQKEERSKELNDQKNVNRVEAGNEFSGIKLLLAKIFRW
ncbi:hypothetical protein [Pedobacter rhizosphaerae]|uniref:Uncharacterized protein n=1 Tax=Pedobacter rhizosphaerae TaxID=390241 RepID=A0A1H9MUP3_9SPHI|nr:hypothetical protein [Pedobacter rhizosphaerae]SER26833.1 hypothetical protein SAMN04488023_106134 [Pedobacter rhizosphaerae]